MRNIQMSEKLYTDKNSEYLKQNPTWHAQDSSWKASNILNILNRNHITPKSISEVGCGAGEILNQLHAALPDNIEFTGFDISSDAIRLASEREKQRLTFKNENFLELNRKFDLVLIMDVFEHVEDYVGFLKKCKGKAEYTVFHIPLDLSAQSILRNKLIYERKTLGHLHYFMKETALATLVDLGYEIVDHFYTNGALERPSNTFKSRMIAWPRRILYKINKDFAVKLLGGCSLLVLAK